MTNKINLFPTPQLVKPLPSNNAGVKNTAAVDSFAEVLHSKVQKQQPVKLSAHAQRRLAERNIALEPGAMVKINQAVHKAAAKGAQDALLIYGDLALITNIKNKTVITAMDGQSLKEHVFTNIDSAVIIK